MKFQFSFLDKQGADKNNTKSQNILKHLGLQNVGMNKNGNSYHYRGDFNYFVNVFIT